MTRSFRPANLAEAVGILGDPGVAATAVAGATDLLVVDHASGRSHAAVVDLLGIPELRGIVLDGDMIDLGAATTFSALRTDPIILRELPVLAEMAATIGGWQIQNRATLGGNIANASPAGDALPLLLALDAELRIAGSHGIRTLAYDRMHLGYRKTALEAGELIARIRIPRPAAGTRVHFRKVGTRAAQAISKVVVAFAGRLEEGCWRRLRLAAGSVGPVPLRLLKAEAVAEGVVASRPVAEAAARTARDEVTPIDDVRSTAVYRRHALERLVRRFLIS